MSDYKPLFPEENESLDGKLKELGYEPETEETETEKEEEKEKEEEVEGKEEEKEEETGETGEEEKEETSPGETEETVGPEPKEEKEKKAPPAGYVPKEALFEERGKRKALNERLAERENRLNELAEKLAKLEERIGGKTEEKEETDPFTDFKVLSEEDFRNLQDEDPIEAQNYLFELNRYQLHQREKERENNKKREQQSLLQKRQEEENWKITKAVEKLVQAIPGFYNEDNDINSRLAKFAIERGASPEAISVMTDPRTKIIPYGQEEPIVAGTYATEMILLINNLFESLNNSSNKEELEKKIREEVTKEITSKLHDGTALTEHVSLGEAPTARTGKDMKTSGKTYTEAEWASLSKDERERLLGGPA